VARSRVLCILSIAKIKRYWESGSTTPLSKLMLVRDVLTL
jgi:hypothetical protein